jgi:hypothetical protein
MIIIDNEPSFPILKLLFLAAEKWNRLGVVILFCMLENSRLKGLRKAYIYFKEELAQLVYVSSRRLYSTYQVQLTLWLALILLSEPKSSSNELSASNHCLLVISTNCDRFGSPKPCSHDSNAAETILIFFQNQQHQPGLPVFEGR